MFSVTSKSDKSNYIYVQGARVTSDKNDASGLIMQNFNQDTGDKQNLASLISRVTHLSESNYAGDLVFKTLSNGTLDERMRLDARGYMGINTSEPEELLTVNGNTYVRSNLYVDNDIKTSKLIFEPSGNTVRSIDNDAFANISFPEFSREKREIDSLMGSHQWSNEKEFPVMENNSKDQAGRCIHVCSLHETVTQSEEEDTWCTRARISVPMTHMKKYTVCLTFQLQNPEDVSNYTGIKCTIGDDLLYEGIEYVPVFIEENAHEPVKLVKSSPVKTINIVYEKKEDDPDLEKDFTLSFKSSLPFKRSSVGYFFIKVDELAAS